MKNPAKASAARPASAARGFTLIEMLVVLAIVGILAAVAFPSLRTMIARKAVVTYAEALASALIQSRSEAMKRGMPVTICASNDPAAATPACLGAGTWNENTGWFFFLDRNADGVVDDVDKVIGVQQGLGHVGAVTENNATTSVLFLATGVSTVAQDLEFLIRPALSASDSAYASASRRVMMGKSGRVKVAEGDGS